MKRGRSSLKTFPSREEPAKRQKRLAPCFPLSPSTDWGNLPHHVVLQIFQHLSLVDRARASSVCRRWNDVFHTPDLWRRFEFELNQPATSYLRSTHPDLIQQIIMKHAQHLQYVSFKVRTGPALFLQTPFRSIQQWPFSSSSSTAPIALAGLSSARFRWFSITLQ